MKAMNKLLAVTLAAIAFCASALALDIGPPGQAFDVKSFEPVTVMTDTFGNPAVFNLKTMTVDPLIVTKPSVAPTNDWALSYAYSLSGRQYVLASGGFGPDRPLGSGGFAWNYGPSVGLDLDRNLPVAGIGAWIDWHDKSSPLFGRAGLSLIGTGSEKPDISLGMTLGYKIGG